MNRRSLIAGLVSFAAMSRAAPAYSLWQETIRNEAFEAEKYRIISSCKMLDCSIRLDGTFLMASSLEGCAIYLDDPRAPTGFAYNACYNCCLIGDGWDHAPWYKDQTFGPSEYTTKGIDLVERGNFWNGNHIVAERRECVDLVS